MEFLDLGMELLELLLADSIAESHGVHSIDVKLLLLYEDLISLKHGLLLELFNSLLFSRELLGRQFCLALESLDAD